MIGADACYVDQVMSATDYLWQYAPNLRQPAEWLKAASGAILSIVAGVVTYGVALPAIASAKIPVLCGIAISVAVLTIWYLFRIIYLKRGSGCRLGIVYAMHRVLHDDWKWTRRELDKCFASGDLRTHVSLRMLPQDWCRTPEQIEQMKRRYGFYAIIAVTMSEPLDATQRVPRLKAQIAPSVKASISAEFAQRLSDHTAMIGRSHQQLLKSSVADALEHQAHSLFEIVLLLLGVWRGADGDHETAATTLGALDKRLADRFGPSEAPRLAIRRMTAKSLIAESNFLTSNAPPEPRLSEIIARCDIAIERYGSQFPFLFRVQARNKYFRGDSLDDIAALSNHALTHDTDQRVRYIAMLDMAVLNLLMSRFQQSAKYFRDWLAAGDPSSLNLDDLIDFAEMASERYDHAVFIRAFYRRIRGDQPFPKDLERSVQGWILQDGSREALGQIYAQVSQSRAKRAWTGAQQSPKRGRKRRGKGKRRRGG